MTLDRMPRWLPFLVGLVLLVAHNLRFWPWTLDDAFITFRYAENLAEGLGPVFNPGERVEGYTNFLWMILLSGAHALGADTLTAAKALGALLTLASTALLCVGDRIVPAMPRKTALAAALLSATSPLVTRWSLSGMEVSLLLLLLLSAVLLHLRDREQPRLGGAVALGVLCALASMTRPDAGLLFAALGLDRLWQVLRRAGREAEGGAQRRGALAGMLAFGLVFVAVYGAYFGWRWSYYGWLLPNTFYVKVGSSLDQAVRGLYYTGKFLYVSWALGLAAPLMLLVPRLRPAPGSGLWMLAGLICAHTAYVISVGGDVMYGYRFFAAYIPLMALVLAGIWAAQPVGGRLQRGILPVALALNLGWMAISEQLNYTGLVGRFGTRIGLWLREVAPPDALLAVNVAGTLPYYSRLPTIDTLGLNDEHIAHREIATMGQGWAGHEKGDGAYVLSRAPDYVVFSSSLGAKKPRFVGDIELFQRDEFHRDYALHVYQIDKITFTVWVRRPEAGGRGLQATPERVFSGDLRNTVDAEEIDRSPARSWW